MSLPAAPYPPPLAPHLGLIMDGLRAMIAHHAAHNRAIQPVVLLLWNYLGRAVPRLARLIARCQAGRLAAPRPPAAPSRTNSPIAATPAVAKPRARLPGGNAWLVRLIQPTAQFSGQIEALLARPEMAELLAAAPQAGRILRPLCRMLGIKPFPPVLRRPAPAPPPVPTAAPRPPPTSAPRRARPTCPLSADLPLPRRRFSPG